MYAMLGLIAFATAIGLVGIWFPDWFNKDIGWKLFGSAVVLFVGVAVATSTIKLTGLAKDAPADEEIEATD